MLGKRQQWIPNTSFNPTIRFSLLRTWNIRVDGDPGTRKDRNNTTPHNVPYCTTVCDVCTMIGVQRATIDEWDGDRVDRLRGTLIQVIEKE